MKPAAHASQHQADPKAQQIYVHLLTNAALCLLKITSKPGQKTAKSGHEPITTESLMQKCINLCTNALEIDPINAKALYRIAQVSYIWIDLFSF